MQKKFIFPELLNQILSDKFQNRFWSKIKKKGADECWIWTASTCQGYGQIWIRCLGKKHHLKSHQLSWMIKNEQVIPSDKWILHSCVNQRDCCNPAHLRLGTRLENVADMIRQGRVSNRKGENSATSKFTNEHILALRAAHASGNYSRKELMEMFQISDHWLSDVTGRRAWTHI